MSEIAAQKAGRFTYVRDWQAMTPESAHAIREFWRGENALGAHPGEAERRLSEVVVHALGDDGRVVAVCSAYPATLAATGQPMYHYRCFIGRQWRTSLLMRTMIRQATICLEEYARTHDYPCVGIVVELENPRFRDTLIHVPVWHSPGLRFVYIGKSPRGLDMRIHYFRGARLKRS